MEIFYLGHAGFLITHDNSSVIIDPWLSEHGAFNRAWYQFPRNHHLRSAVSEKIKDLANVRIILSHEHADHFCRDTLSCEELRPIGIVVPEYRAKGFYNAVQEFREEWVSEAADREEFRVGSLNISFIIDDSGLDRDAGILVRSDQGSTFLNFNDCKAFDQLQRIRDKVGVVDVFTCQSSGAIRHPICYEYDEHYYAQVARHKRLTKFEVVRAAIETLKPRIFLPSAGPCVFLDPNLFHFNFEERGEIFGKSWDFVNFIRATACDTKVEELMPGDTLSCDGQSLEISKAAPVVSAATYDDYMQQYQRECWQPANVPRGKSRRLEEMFLTDLKTKIEVYRQWGSGIDVEHNLYFQTSADEPYIKVDFALGEISETSKIDESNFFIHKLSWEEIAALYDDGLGWSGHALTFRFSIQRTPDVYDPVIDLFLTSSIEEFRDGLQYLDRIRLETETIEVAAADGQRFRIRRYCPHQGADLLGARIEGFEVICPRHGWKFDLKEGGVCYAKGFDIAAKAL